MEIIKKTENSDVYAVPKIIETPKHIIMNTQMYDKTTFNPMKFNFLDFNDLTFAGHTSLVLHRMIRTNYNNTNRYFEQLPKTNHCCMVRDSSHDDIFYQINGWQTVGGCIRAIQEIYDETKKQYSYKVLWETSNGQSVGSCNGSFYGGDFEILYQEDDYLIIKQSWPQMFDQYSWRDWGSNNNNVFVLEKETFTIREIHGARAISDASYNYYYLEKAIGSHYIYIQYHCQHHVIKYDYQNNATDTIYSNEETGCAISGNIVKINGFYYYLVDGVARNGKNEYQLCRIKIIPDYTGTSVIHEYIDIEGNEAMDIDGTALMANVNHVLLHDLKTIKTDNGNYIVIIARSPSNGVWFSTQHKLVVIKITDDGRAIVKQVVPFTSIPCKGVLSYYYEEEGHADVLITLHDSCCKFWKFDYEQEKYIETFSVTDIFYCIGIDEQNRVYLQNKDNAIQMYDKIDTTTLKVYFKDEYVAERHNQTSLYYWAKNFLNEYTEEEVVITLSNGVTFEDGSIQKTFKTSKGGPTEVPVYITTTCNTKATATIRVTTS